MQESAKNTLFQETDERQPPRSISYVLGKMIATGQPSYTIGEVANRLADRSMAGLLAFFSAINMIPAPFGSSMITGIPVVFIAFRLMLGARTVWLPHFVAKREISAERMTKIVDKITPWLLKLENLLKPRYWPFQTETLDRWLGLACVVLAVLLVLPIPLGNWLPACSVFVLGMALSERDGVWLSIGAALGIASLVIVAIVVGGAYAAVDAVVS